MHCAHLPHSAAERTLELPNIRVEGTRRNATPLTRGVELNRLRGGLVFLAFLVYFGLNCQPISAR
jgi:hypothetical protein